jgi:hypothetical protein
MGDTVLPVKAFIQKEESALFYFRGALLPEYQRALGDLFVRAENQVAAITMAENLPRSESLHLAMLVSLAHDLIQMQQKIDDLEQVRYEALNGDEAD